MIKVLFVCLGNICRSPMAEFLFKDIVKKKNIENEFIIESAGTSDEEEGNTVHYKTRNLLANLGISTAEKRARKLEKEDYEKFDYILAMEENNIRDIIQIVGEDKDNKIHRLLDYTNNPRNIADPWYTRNFNVTYNDIVEGLEAFLNYLNTNKIE